MYAVIGVVRRCMSRHWVATSRRHDPTERSYGAFGVFCFSVLPVKASFALYGDIYGAFLHVQFFQSFVRVGAYMEVSYIRCFIFMCIHRVVRDVTSILQGRPVRVVMVSRVDEPTLVFGFGSPCGYH